MARSSGFGITRNRPVWWASKASAMARLAASDSAALRCSDRSCGPDHQCVIAARIGHQFLLRRIDPLGPAGILGLRDPRGKLGETVGTSASVTVS